ncbi:MAG TPA: cytoplasmic protein [Acidobacteriota bacterium]|jgi:hypothetical protein
MKRVALFLLVLVSLVVAYTALSAARSEDLDPVKVAGDTHKLVLENKFVRVLETKIPAGKSEPMHEHRRGVVIYLSDFKVRVTERGAKPQEAVRHNGDIRWRENTVHSVKNIGTTEGHVISVELK